MLDRLGGPHPFEKVSHHPKQSEYYATAGLGGTF